MKLSIITVNLNNLEGLKKTYESVVCQTFTDYEWLVIDGGSTDGSREFIEEHQDKIKWEYVARYQTITEEFFWKHQDKIDVNFLVKSQKVDTSHWSARFQELKQKEAAKAEVLY